jgi:hypothetical protein
MIGWCLFLLGALTTIPAVIYLIWIQLNPEFASAQPTMISGVILGIPPIAAGWYLVATARRRAAGRATISSAALQSASDRHT